MSNAKFGSSLLIILLGISLFYGCNEPDDFGAGFVEQDLLPIQYDQIFELRGNTSLGESEVTFSEVTRGGDSLIILGNFSDPVFGKVNAVSYFQMRNLPSVEVLEGITCDSVVLDLRIAQNRVYGDTSKVFNMTVHRLDDPLLNDTLLRSDEYRTFNANEVGRFENVQITPNTRIETSDTTSVGFFISTHLNTDFGQEIISNPDAYETVADFLQFFKGLAIKIDPATESPIFGINVFRRNAGGWSPGDTRMSVYYSGPDTSGVISFGIVDVIPRYTTYEHDYTGMPVENFLTDEPEKPEYLFVEGLSGLRPRIIMPDLDEYEGKSIKVAYLEVVIAEEFNGRSNEDFPIPNQLAVSSLTEEGDLNILGEFIRFQTAGIIQSQFGGNPVPGEIDGQPVTLYRLNISQYLQSYLNGTRSGTLVPTVFGSAKRPERAILYGPGHPQFSARLKIIYSDI